MCVGVHVIVLTFKVILEGSIRKVCVIFPIVCCSNQSSD